MCQVEKLDSSYACTTAHTGAQGRGVSRELSYTLETGNGQAVKPGSERVVRKLTPVECERLQGFPDGWTCIPWNGKPAEECPDGPRYKACGNSMAVPVMKWIGERMCMVDFLEPEVRQ